MPEIDAVKKLHDALGGLNKEVGEMKVMQELSGVFSKFFEQGKSGLQIMADLTRTTEQINRSQMSGVKSQIKHLQTLQTEASKFYKAIGTQQKKILKERLDALKKEEKHLKMLSKLPDEIAKHFQNARGAIGKAIGGASLAKDLTAQAGLNIPGMDVVIEGLKGAQAGGWQGAIGGAAWGAFKTWMDAYKEFNIIGEHTRKTAFNIAGAFNKDLNAAASLSSKLWEQLGENVKDYGIQADETLSVMQGYVASGMEPTAESLKNMNKFYLSLTKTMGVSSGTFTAVASIIKKDFGGGFKELTKQWDLLKESAEKVKMPIDMVAQDLSKLTQSFLDTGIATDTMAKMFNKNVGKMSYSRNLKNIQAMMGGVTGADVGHAAFYSQYTEQYKGMSPEAAAMGVKFGGLNEEDIKGIMRGVGAEMGIDYEKLTGGGMGKEEALSSVYKMSALTGISGARFMEQIPEMVKLLDDSDDGQGRILENADQQLLELGKMRSFLSQSKDYLYDIRRDVSLVSGDIDTSGTTRMTPEERKRFIKEQEEKMKQEKKKAEDEAKKKEREEKGGGVFGLFKKKQHFGGMVDWPRYHNGLAPDERKAILQTGEGVLSRGGVANVGGASGVHALNSGQAAGSSVNVNVNIPVLKQAIEEAVRRVMRESPSMVMF